MMLTIGPLFSLLFGSAAYSVFAWCKALKHNESVWNAIVCLYICGLCNPGWEQVNGLFGCTEQGYILSDPKAQMLNKEAFYETKSDRNTNN